MEEIPETKVLISLYDYDSDEPDDSLGEVVIHLQQDDFFNRIVTKWFTIQPKVGYCVLCLPSCKTSSILVFGYLSDYNLEQSVPV